MVKVHSVEMKDVDFVKLNELTKFFDTEPENKNMWLEYMLKSNVNQITLSRGLVQIKFDNVDFNKSGYDDLTIGKTIRKIIKECCVSNQD